MTTNDPDQIRADIARTRGGASATMSTPSPTRSAPAVSPSGRPRRSRAPSPA